MHSDTRLVAAQLLEQALRGQPPSAGPRLVVVEGPDTGRTLPVSRGDTLGRGGTAQLPLRDPATSRRHARLEDRDGQLSIVDLGSKNGIELNGRRVRSRATLRDGDRVRMGATVLEAAGLGALRGVGGAGATAGGGAAASVGGSGAGTNAPEVFDRRERDRSAAAGAPEPPRATTESPARALARPAAAMLLVAAAGLALLGL